MKEQIDQVIQFANLAAESAITNKIPSVTAKLAKEYFKEFKEVGFNEKQAFIMVKELISQGIFPRE